MCVLEVDERRHANHDVLGYPGEEGLKVNGIVQHGGGKHTFARRPLRTMAFAVSMP